MTAELDGAGDGTVQSYSATMNDRYSEKTFFTRAEHNALVANKGISTFMNELIEGRVTVSETVYADPKQTM